MVVAKRCNAMTQTQEQMRPQGPVRRRRTGVNVPAMERIASVGLGGIALFSGRRLSTLPKILLSALGLALIGRGLSGRCPYYRLRSSRDELVLRHSILIDAARKEVFATWRDLEGLPRFLTAIESVAVKSFAVSEWRAAMGPIHLTWSAEITEEIPEQLLRWRSLADSEVEHEGSIEVSEFSADNSTLLTLEMKFRPSGAMRLSSFRYLARRFTDQVLAAGLLRFKQFVETGEISTGANQRPELGASSTAAGSSEIPVHNAEPMAEA